MRRRFMAIAALGALMLCLPVQSAFALQGDSAGNVFSNDENPSVYSIDRDLYWAGSSLNLSSAGVGGDVLAAGSNITVGDCSIEGNLRSASATLDVRNSIVAGNITAAGQTLNVDSGSLAGGVYLAGQNVTFSGYCLALKATAENVVIDGEIDGDAEVEADNVTIGDNAIIHGTLYVSSDNEPTIAAGAEMGGYEFTQTQNDAEQVGAAAVAAKMMSSLFGFLFTLATGVLLFLLMCWLVPRALTGSGAMYKTRTAQTILTGVIGLLLMAPAIILLCCLVVTLPVAGILALAFGIIAIAAMPFAAGSVGQMVFPQLSRYLSGLIFIGVFGILSLVPVLNTILALCEVAYLLGYVLQYAYLGLARRKAERNQLPPQGFVAPAPVAPQAPVPPAPVVAEASGAPVPPQAEPEAAPEKGEE